MNLEDINLWWHDKNWEKKDFELKKFNKMPIRWIPSWLDKLSLKPFSLNFVVGPRQVGKTTGIKLLIDKLLSTLKPMQIFYLDLELLTDLKELREALLFYFELRKKEKLNHSFLFLDEVTKLEGWYNIVKGFIDLGELKKDVVIVSGSSSANLLKHAESFAGRRGKGKDIFVMPLSFKEFVEVNKVNVKRKDKVKEAFLSYTELGGFPKSINKLTKGEEFIKAFELEIMKNDLSVEIAKQIFFALFDMVPSALSFNAIANKIGKSNKTVEAYIETFQDLFIAKIAYWKDKQINFRKEKKIFLRDPFLARTFAWWCNKEIRKDFLYEWIVQEHLLRKFGEIYYYRNRYEIDCIAKNLKVEVKAGKPYRKYPRGVKVVDETNIAEFLLSLEI